MYDEVKDYRNLSDNSSLPLTDIQASEMVYDRYLSNQNLPLENTIFQPKLDKMSNELEYLEELDNRPVDSHFNSEKGYKFDVTVKDQEKYVIQNERLGDVDVLPHPFFTLIR